MINLIGPASISSLSFDGNDYTVADGKVSVKPEHARAFDDFGFAPAATGDDPNFVPSDDIGTMNRNELFAFLKAKGVAVSPPITNDQLRAIARENADAPVAGAAVAPAPLVPAAEPEALPVARDAQSAT